MLPNYPALVLSNVQAWNSYGFGRDTRYFLDLLLNVAKVSAIMHEVAKWHFGRN